MNKPVLMLFLFFLVLPLSAQPQLTNESIPQIGETYTFTLCDTTGVTEGTSGESQTWDFSNLVLQTTPDATFTNEVVPATEGFKYEMFPNADYAYKNDSSYSYFRMGGVALERLGSGYSAGQEVLDKPEIIYSLPFTYSNIWTDDFSGTVVTSSSGMTITMKRYGRVTTEADGYGSIILPNGTFHNVLRMKIKQQIWDTIDVGVPGMPVTISFTDHESYFWVSDKYKYGLLSINNITSTTSVMGHETVVKTKNVILHNVEGEQLSLTQPQITKPVNNAQDLTFPIEIEWTASELLTGNSIKSKILEEVSYILEISDDSDFAVQEDIIEIEAGATTSYIFDEEVDAENLYFRVKAVYSDIVSDWSDVVGVSIEQSEINLTTPEILSPTDGEFVELPVMISWTESEGAEPSEIAYVLEVTIAEDFEDRNYVIEYEPVTATSILFELEEGQHWSNFKARVKAVYGDMLSDWSEIVSFSVAPKPLDPPTAVSPIDGAENVEPLGVKFSWDYSVTADDYLYYLRYRVNDEITTIYIHDDRFYETDLMPDSEYFWALKVENLITGDSSDWSDEMSFTTGPSTSIREITFNGEDLIALPNPAADILNIRFESMSEEELMMKLVSIDGHIVYQQNLGICPIGTNNISLPLSVSNGTYYLLVEGMEKRMIRNVVIAK